MKYEYITATGKTEIEVDEHFEQLLKSMDKEEYNSNRKHSRWQYISLDNIKYDGEWFEDKNNPINDTEVAIQWEQVSTTLTALQQLCFFQVCLNGKTAQSVAVELGIKQQAVDKHIQAARKKIKKIF